MNLRVMFTFVFFNNFNIIIAINIASKVISLYNVPLVDETGFKIDMQFNDSDYQMINDSEIQKSQIIYPDERFKEFNKIAKLEYDKSKYYHDHQEQRTNKLDIVTLSTMQNSIHPIQKRCVKDNELENDDMLVNDVTDIKIDLLKLQIPWIKLQDFMKQITVLNLNENCTDEDLRGVGIKAIKCTLSLFGKKQKSFRFLIENLMEIMTIWVLIYFIFALPLWCTKGWCSCCLCCKFFKPQETIQEAKNYLLLNPPGTLVTKKGGIIHYEPTEREKDCYEEFGHFIRTL